jgi:hypothetical protein
MTGLNANHKRRILASFEYADKLLEECLHTPAPGRRPLFSGYVQDLSPSESHWVESYADKIREQMSRLLERCGIEAHPPTTLRSWKLRTGLISDTLDAIRNNAVPLDDLIRVRRFVVDGRLSHLKIIHASGRK